MKKEHKIILSLAFLFSLVFILSTIQNLAAVDQPAYPLGINPSQIQQLPQTPEELTNASTNYIKAQLGTMLSKIPGLVKTQEFLKSHPMFFTIVFNEKYDITWVFFLIVLLWLYTMSITADLTEASPLLGNNRLYAMAVGIGFAIILAQLGILRAIVIFSINLISAQSLWWVRGILGFLIILIFIVIYYAKSVVGGGMKAKQKETEEERLKQEAKEGKAFREGAEEGEKLTEPIRKIKKKYPMNFG